MNVKYKGGHLIPKNVLEAMRYTGKVGVITKETWSENFSVGTQRWKNKQLSLLMERDILMPHSCGSLDSAYVLTAFGIKTLKGLRWTCVSPVLPQYIKHDEAVAVSAFKLEKRGFCQSWVTEKELKTFNSEEFLVQGKDGEVKYPDAILKANILGKSRTVAIEYERTGKSFSRYRSILWQYNRLTNVSMVLYVVEEEAIKKRIKNALKFQGNTQILERLAFVDADKWIADPLTCHIELRTKISSFEKLCSLAAA